METMEHELENRGDKGYCGWKPETIPREMRKESPKNIEHNVKKKAQREGKRAEWRGIETSQQIKRKETRNNSHLRGEGCARRGQWPECKDQQSLFL